MRGWCKPWKYCTVYHTHIREDLAQSQLGTTLRSTGAGEIRHFCESDTQAHRQTPGEDIMNTSTSFFVVCAKEGDERGITGGPVSSAITCYILPCGFDQLFSVIRASCQTIDPHNPDCRQQLSRTWRTHCMPFNSGPVQPACTC